MKSITRIYDCSKSKCLVNIVLWSSILPPWRVPCIHKNWSSVPLPTFLVTKINKERQPHQKIFFMKDISTMIGTHNWNVWVKHVKHRGMIVSLLFITCKQFISISFETTVSSLSKKSISHEHLNIKDISYQQQVFPLFHNIRFSSHFFLLHLKA